MVVEAWTESQEVGRSKLCVEPLELTGPIVEQQLAAVMMQQVQHHPLTCPGGSPRTAVVAAAISPADQRATAAP
jgi:hypothetical protein